MADGDQYDGNVDAETGLQLRGRKRQTVAKLTYVQMYFECNAHGWHNVHTQPLDTSTVIAKKVRAKKRPCPALRASVPLAHTGPFSASSRPPHSNPAPSWR